MKRSSKLGGDRLPRLEAQLRQTVDDPQLWQWKFGKQAKRLNQPQLELAHSKAREKVGRMGRRCGKSIYLGENDIPRWAITHPETLQWVMAPTQDQANIIYGYFQGILEESPLELLVKHRSRSPWPQMELWNGARLTARNLGYEGRNVRGNSGDRLLLDEAAFVGDMTIERAVSPIIAASKWAETVKISTPNGLNHFWKSCMDGTPGDAEIQSFHHPTWHNTFLDRRYLLTQKRKRSSLSWLVEYGAEFVEDQNSQFPWSLIEKCIDPDASWHPRVPILGHRYVIGYDPADTHDRSAVIVLDITVRPFRVVDIAAIGGFGYKVQESRIAELSYRWNHAQIHMDDTGHKSFCEQLQKLERTVIDGRTVDVDLEVAGFTYTNLGKRELMENLRIVMEQDGLRFPFHEDLTSELKFFRREISQAGNVKFEALEGEYDDYVNALALAVAMAGWIPAGATGKAKFGVY